MVWLSRWWPAVALAALLGASHWWIYQHGVTVTDGAWSARWEKRNTDDAEAQAATESAARAKEQALQRQAEKVQRDATQALEQARTDAAGASAAADRLREQVRQLLARKPGTAPSIAPSGAAGPDSCGMLAVVLDKSVERNRRLAEIADSALVGWKACAAVQ